jgi:hypothetical protein
MAIIETIDLSLFRSRFADYGREKDFSYEGLEALYEYLNELSEDCDVPMEMDVISICCDFCEYDSGQLFREFTPHRGMSVTTTVTDDDGEEEEEDIDITSENAQEIWDKASEEDREIMIEELVEKLKDHTTVLEVDGNDSYIVETF